MPSSSSDQSMYDLKLPKKVEKEQKNIKLGKRGAPEGFEELKQVSFNEILSDETDMHT